MAASTLGRCEPKNSLNGKSCSVPSRSGSLPRKKKRMDIEIEGDTHDGRKGCFPYDDEGLVPLWVTTFPLWLWLLIILGLTVHAFLKGWGLI